jgi:NAD(P)-dependent dehydrogenase (short-subunit alcohol dehydrogenase family)
MDELELDVVGIAEHKDGVGHGLVGVGHADFLAVDLAGSYHELRAFAGSWAAEYGPRGVRVNTVAPGVTLTPGNEAHRAQPDLMTAGTPAGVVVQPEDIAKAVVYLASDDPALIHGATL